MNDKTINLNIPTILDIPSDKVLKAAIGNVDDVVLIDTLVIRESKARIVRNK